MKIWFSILLLIFSGSVWAARETPPFAGAAPINTDGLPAGLARLTLPPEVIDRLRPDLGDLRIFDDGDRITPYALRPGETWLERMASKTLVLEPLLSLDSGETAAPLRCEPAFGANTLRLAGPKTLVLPNRIEQMNADGTVRVLAEGAYTARIEEEGGVTRTVSITLPEDVYERLRLVYPAGDGVWREIRMLRPVLVYVKTPEAVGLVAVPLETVAESGRLSKKIPGTTIHEWRCLYRNLQLAWVRVDFGEGWFSRPYDLGLWYSRKGEMPPGMWSSIGSGEFMRKELSGHVLEQMAVFANTRTTDRVRLALHDGDNPPLTLRHFAAFARLDFLVFQNQPGRRYTLCFGHPTAPMPRYDLDKLLQEIDLSALPEATVGAVTPDRPRQRQTAPPWLEQNVAIRWAVLVLAAGVMFGLLGLALKRQMQDTEKTSDTPSNNSPPASPDGPAE